MGVGVERIWRSMPAEWAKEMVSRGYIGAKYLLTKLQVWVDDSEVNRWADSKNIFFILGIGRSGTNFLAHLLNQAPRVLVVHEPLLNESKPHQDAFINEKKAHAYIKCFRKKEIYLRVKKQDIDTYGEVNSYLRRHCKALREAFPNAKFFHLVRDGRAFVRSSLSRNSMKVWAPDTYRIRPKEDDIFRKEWPHMTRFEKLCWYWRVENQYLRKYIPETLKFESIISDYDYLRERLLEPLRINIPEPIWQKIRTQPKNVTRRYTLPHWNDWPQELKETFRRICGDEMETYGYDL